MSVIESRLLHLECARCGTRVDADCPQTFCSCGGTWLARYDLDQAGRSLTRSSLASRPAGLWRWAEVLPVRDPRRRRGLGEGGTPLRRAPKLGRAVGIEGLLLKDEGMNPGGSFKARGMAVAVARAVELGLTRFALPSAGNAGGAASSYASYWGAEARVALPRWTPSPFRLEVEAHGGLCHLVDGDIAAAGKWLMEEAAGDDWFFLSTLKEPYRVEGKKTMGYEIVEQMGGRWPEVVIYPTGGGTGIVGMAKADAEMRALGLVEGPYPRFVVVQAEGCAPLVRAHDAGETHAAPWKDPATAAYGLRVPGTIGDHLILDALRAGGGTALTVTEAEMQDARVRFARVEGLNVAPEAAATLVAAERLRSRGWIGPRETVALFLTGNGFKYPLEESAA